MKYEEIILVQIRKEEAMKLNKMGIPFGEGGISRSHSSSKSAKSKYYLCENKTNLTKLKQIRK